MNNGLNGEGKNVINEVDSDSKFAENLTNFYNNKELTEKNKSTSVMSDTVKLEKKEDSAASNAIYDFVMKLKKHIIEFINPKRIKSEEEFKNRLAASRTITLIPIFFTLFHFIDVHGIWNIVPLVLLCLSYYFFSKNNRKGIYTAIAASVLLILSFNFINVVLGVFYLYGNIMLFIYKKDS